VKSYVRGLLAGAVLGAVAYNVVRRRIAPPRRMMARWAWRAGRDLTPRAVRLTRYGGRRLLRIARRIG
jgi:hypothetical protein